MKTLFLAAVAAVGLALAVAPQQASAAWVTRTAYRWDPYCGRYVAYPERVWVPDCHDHHHHHPEPSYYRGRDYHDHRNHRDRGFSLDLNFGLDRFRFGH